MSSKLAVPDHEFAPLPELAESLRASAPDPHLVQRRWVTTVSGGHVSGVTWGAGPAETVLLHDARRSARSFDRLLILLDRPALALDLPGHGRSGWRGNGVYSPRLLAPAVREAVHSFAPNSKVVAGAGLGALTAIALTVRSPELVRALVLLDTLPGSPPAPGPEPGPYSSQEEALEALRAARPGAPEEDLVTDVRYETLRGPEGTWTWRHHLGHLPGDAAARLDDATLWDQLTALAGRRVPIVLVRPETGGLLSEAAVAELRRRAPDARIVTAGEKELAGLLRELLDDPRRSTA
ncbi:alpha/beta fold hydrolase [Sphaerisporangium corydalis]|uniref:Alpha/beta fold hydrolase n=1 Tax=Sphaerisporangium corydalis TaxID=1441875 RepID=A0ABV9EG51_9ACTN|nr:alpha/beta hydrolase [Sphaerisporangium corydalis]